MELDTTIDTEPMLAEPVAESRSESPVQPSMESDADLVEDEFLVEEISIDGMCGVY